MAIPTQPTKTTLATEGLKKAGYPSPSAAQLTRAEDEYLEEIKWEIWNKNKRWKSLMIHAYCVTIKGINRYALPDDNEHILSMQILDGEDQGDVAAVTDASEFTLDANANQTTEQAQGKLILIKAGTAKGAASQIDDWNNTTKVVSVIPNMSTLPDTTSDYMIIDHHYPLIEKPVQRLDEDHYPHDLEIPSHYFPIGQGNADSDETGEFYLFPTPNNVYGVQMRYYANLMLVDTASNLMKTLYRRWRNLWVYGTAWKALETDRDARYDRFRQVFFNILNEMHLKEVYGHNLTEMQTVIVE
jgi:hypothetical protein